MDAWDHFRRALLTALHFPHPPYLDYFYGFPHGIHYNQPPLWELTLAFPAWLIWGSRLTPDLFTHYVVFVPPIIGGITVAIIYLCAKELFGKKVGITSAILAALFPGLNETSRVGSVDRHVFESFWISAILLFLALALRKSPRWGVAAGFCITALMLTWLGSPLVIFVIGLYFAVAGVIYDESLPVLAAGITAFSSALVFLAMTIPFRAVALAVVFDRLSLLHVVLLSSFMLLFTALFLSRRHISKGLSVIILGTSLAAILAAFLIPELRLALILGAKKAFGLYPVARRIGEWQPLFLTYGHFTLSKMLQRYSFAFLAIPLIFPLIFSELAKSPTEPEKSLFASWFLLFFAMGLTAGYYYPLFSAPLVISLALLAVRFSEIRLFKNSRLPKLSFAILTVICLIMLALFAPEIMNYEPDLAAQLYSDLHRIEKLTPPPANPLDPSAPPKYSIISPWSYGQYIVSIANRPSVATGNFEANFGGFVDQQKFFQSHTEEEALKIARRDKVKYVFVGPNFSYCFGNIALSGPNLSSEPQPVYLTAMGLNVPEVQTSLYGRLYFGDPPGKSLPPLKHFKLVFEDDRFLIFKLYEIVP